jgi:hypothetical protein
MRDEFSSRAAISVLKQTKLSQKAEGKLTWVSAAPQRQSPLV